MTTLGTRVLASASSTSYVVARQRATAPGRPAAVRNHAAAASSRAVERVTADHGHVVNSVQQQASAGKAADSGSAHHHAHSTITTAERPRNPYTSSSPCRGTPLDKICCQGHGGDMQDVEVIESAEAAAAALGPVRARLLGELAVPASAAGLAARVGIARQKVNYHLKALEAHGLVELSGERRHGGITERVLQATAASYVVSPAALSAAAADPDANADHLSASYLVALAGRLVREVGALARRAGASGKRLPTLTIDTQMGFRSPADRAAFADDLTAAVLDLAARYHHDDGRPHRLLVAAHPLPEENP